MQYDLTNMERAEVLTAALPYIRKYTGQIVVVKYGGNAMINEQLKQQVMEDIVLLWLIGVRVVLIEACEYRGTIRMIVTQIFESDEVARTIYEEIAGLIPGTVFTDRGNKIYDRLDLETIEHQ